MLRAPRPVEAEIEYLLRRHEEEKAAAASAGDICARNRHSLLAEKYADRALALDETLDRPLIPNGIRRMDLSVGA